MSEEHLFESTEEIKEDQLTRLSDLCNEYKSIEESIIQFEEELKEKKKKLETISRELIPSILNSNGLSEIKLKSGEKIEIKDQIKASIANKNYLLAYKNMVNSEEGGEDVIDLLFKSKIVVEDNAESEKLREVLLEMDIPYESVKNIHPQTLKKYCKGRLENGLPIPEGISVFQYQETKIK